MTRPKATLAQSLQTARLRLHLEIIPTSAGLSAMLGVVLATALWDKKDHAILVVWLVSLALALALRGLSGWAYGRSLKANQPDHDQVALRDATWLRHLRFSFLVHGLVWGVAGVVLQDVTAVAQFSLLTIGIVAIAAGSLNSTTFDLRASLAFVTAALAPMLLVVFLLGDRVTIIRGMIMVAFMVATFIGARRAEKIFIESESLRLAESERADEAREHARQAELARNKLADQIHLLTLLLHTTKQGFWFIDNDALTTEVNPAMCALMGRTREDALHRPVKDFFAGADLQLMKEQLKACKKGDLGNYEVSLVRPDGKLVFCMCNATPLHDAAGNQLGSVGIWTDLTARRETEVSLKTYELVANSITDMVSVIGEDFQYRMVNDAWCKLLGLPREQALNRKTSDVLSRSISSDERRAALRLCVSEQKVQLLRSRIDFPDGVSRHIETSYYPYMDAESAENVRCVVMVSRDVTQAELSRQQLAESTEYLQRTLNATGDAIFAADSTTPDEPARFVNQQMLDIWGIPHDKLASLTPRDVMSYATPLFEDPNAETRRVEEIIASNLQDESQLNLRNGRVLLRRCIPAQKGEKTLRVWSFKDITERKLAEHQLASTNEQLRQKSEELQRSLDSIAESEVESRALLDAFPGYIVALDRHFHYTYANAAIARFLQTTPLAMIGRHVRDIVGETRFQVVEQEVQLAKKSQRMVQTRHYPATAQRPTLDMEITLVVGRVKADGSQTVYFFGIDITARIQAEQALIAARDAAESASRAKSDFLSHMSHELRTPMNAILGFGQLLELGHQSDADRQDWGREVVKGGRHLLELINEVLDLARVESGKMVVNLEPIDLQPLIDDCLMLVSPQARAHHIALINPTLAQPLIVEADRIRLKQILLNLLSNAVKFNVLGGTVTVSCDVEVNTVRIRVVDTGNGMSPEQLGRLFQPFERLNADRDHIEGTGIGLVLTRRLIGLINGDIGVESEPGKGSIFWITLPLASKVGAK